MLCAQQPAGTRPAAGVSKAAPASEELTASKGHELPMVHRQIVQCVKEQYFSLLFLLSIYLLEVFPMTFACLWILARALPSTAFSVTNYDANTERGTEVFRVTGLPPGTGQVA